MTERRRLRRKMVRWWERLEEHVTFRLSFLSLETVIWMSVISRASFAPCFSAPIFRKSNKALYVILQSEGGMALSKASSLKMWKIHSSMKKPSRLLISAHVVISVTRWKARRARETETPMRPRVSFCEALSAKAPMKTDVQRYVTGMRAAIVGWNR